jgi:hypothetical protein
VGSEAPAPPPDKRIEVEERKEMYQLPIPKIKRAFSLKIALILKTAQRGAS